jgi:pantoate--beta-alanine ligase
VTGRAALAEHTTIASFRAALDEVRAAGRTVGLVPTMGFLHEGHASLFRRAAAECDVAAATVFVNPLQFGPSEDFESYPRDLDRDRGIARDAGIVQLFTPPATEMFPDGAPAATRVSVAGVGDGLEAASRPGHFDGVATVVAKLFAIAGPCRAYFGEKDYQQLAVIRRVTRDLSLPVDIVACPTVREPDGLALSSRNTYLSASERAAATVLVRALETGQTAIEHEAVRDAEKVRLLMAAVIDAEPVADLDYAEVVDPASLTPLTTIAGPVRLVVAARLGPARLIDNMGAMG